MEAGVFWVNTAVVGNKSGMFCFPLEVAGCTDVYEFMERIRTDGFVIGAKLDLREAGVGVKKVIRRTDMCITRQGILTVSPYTVTRLIED